MDAVGARRRWRKKLAGYGKSNIAEPELPVSVRREDVLAISWGLSRWPTKPPSPEALADTIRRLSQDGKYSFLDHGDFRMETRFEEMGRDVFDMEHVLENGQIVGNIVPAEDEGEWKVKMVAPLEGTNRKMGVVPIVVKQAWMLIKTVEWEDR